MTETMGSRISRLRKGKGLSQEMLAEKLGVSSQAVSKWETGQSCPDISLLPSLAKLLDVTVDELLTGNSHEVRVVPEGRRKDLEGLTLRVRILSAMGDKVRVNLPMPLVKAAMEMGVEFVPNYLEGMDPLKNLDLTKILKLVEQGALGKLVEIESAAGDTIEVVVE